MSMWRSHFRRVFVLSICASGLAVLALCYGTLVVMNCWAAPTDDPINHARISSERADHLNYPDFLAPTEDQSPPVQAGS
jgi:hypothetical protein